MARQALQQSVESAAIALDAIWSNKLRSFMTVLGNIVAVTSIIAVVSLIRGLNASVQDAILTGVGADSFTIERRGIVTNEDDAERVRSNPDVTLADAAALRRSSSLVTAVMAQARRVGMVSYGDKSIDDVNIQGVTPEYIDFSTYDAERGRLMSPIEVQRSRPIVVLGWQTADRLFGDGNPIGKVVRIEGVHFRVVGVSAKKGSFFGASQDAFAIVPLRCYQMLYGARQSLVLMVKPRDPSLLDAAMQDATAALRAGRRLKPRQVSNFGMFTSDTFLALYHQATNGIFAVLVGIVALSLVVGGIVIMNIMLMVVMERTREIGLRKALGARRGDIVWQILIESVVLSTFGGGVGTVFGFLVALTVASLTPVPAAVEPWSIGLGLSVTALVGLFFGLYPAVRAARLDPIEALRRE
jgi:putative ABC transport system permease protein